MGEVQGDSALPRLQLPRTMEPHYCCTMGLTCKLPEVEEGIDCSKKGSVLWVLHDSWLISMEKQVLIVEGGANQELDRHAFSATAATSECYDNPFHLTAYGVTAMAEIRPDWKLYRLVLPTPGVRVMRGQV